MTAPAHCASQPSRLLALSPHLSGSLVGRWLLPALARPWHELHQGPNPEQECRRGAGGHEGAQRSGGAWFQLGSPQPCLNPPQTVLPSGMAEVPPKPRTILMLGKMGFQLGPLLAHSAY